mgnify:FL=1
MHSIELQDGHRPDAAVIRVMAFRHSTTVLRRLVAMGCMTRHSAAVRMLLVSLPVMLLAACGSRARLPIEATIGPSPTLTQPQRALIPVVKVAKAAGWPAGTTPQGADGLRVNAFATGLDHPRWLLALPNGDVLVAETNAPPRPDDNRGIKGWFVRRFQKKAGGAVPSANRITLLRDTNADGVADRRFVLLANLNSPFGMTLAKGDLVVANSDALLRFPYRDGDTTITSTGTRITDLPAGPLNHHWTKNVIASPDGATLYVAIGSNSNAAEHGMGVEVDRAMVWAVDARTGAHRVYASGLRNPVGMAWEPTTTALWVAVNERDEIGGDLVPDYMTALREGAFFGWPYSYFGQHLDARVKPQRPDLVARAVVPDYALGAHTASLGLAWSGVNALPATYATGLFVGQHGSWNRNPRSGYKVIFVPFRDGRPSGPALDVLTGFISASGDAMGRPVGVAIDATGALLVADDVGNAIWRVTGRTESSAREP